MSRSPRDRPSAAEKKERQGCTGPVDCGRAVPATSADLVNRPQDFPLGSRGDGRRCSVLNFNVRASLFVGPRLFVVFPQGVQGAPWCRHAQLPASDPCGRTCRNFATCRTTFSTVPSTGCWTNGSMSGNPANASSCPFHLAFKAASHLQDDASVLG